MNRQDKETLIKQLEDSLKLVKSSMTEFEHQPKEEEKDADDDRPNLDAKDAKLLWYPLADTDVNKMKTKGKYRKNYPEGAIIHFTAGRSLKGLSDAVNTSNYGCKQGYVYLTLGNDGSVVQAFPLDEYGSHAGTSTWPTLGENVSKYLVGIEVCCAGKLDNKFTSWFGEKYTDKEVRYSEDIDNIQRGFYHKYTAAQEKSLIELLCWLKHNNSEVFNFDNVLGHDEVASPKGRKNDPGASLSVSMPIFRERLKHEYKIKYDLKA